MHLYYPCMFMASQCGLMIIWKLHNNKHWMMRFKTVGGGLTFGLADVAFDKDDLNCLHMKGHFNITHQACWLKIRETYLHFMVHLLNCTRSSNFNWWVLYKLLNMVYIQNWVYSVGNNSVYKKCNPKKVWRDFSLREKFILLLLIAKLTTFIRSMHLMLLQEYLRASCWENGWPL